MVPKRAVRKQQDTSHSLRPLHREVEPIIGENAQPGVLASLSSVADAFNASVNQCILDADAEAVHRLRTGSRRVQAMLEAALRADDSGGALELPARAWLRELKKVRQAAGVVRDLDVHRSLLNSWPGQGKPRTMEIQTQVVALDAWLRNKRKQLARGMQKEIEKRRQRLMERQCMLLVALSSIPAARAKGALSADSAALEGFVRATDEMPSLHAENLHDFRKATKKARYLAEAGTQDRPHSNVAKALKRVQDSIGAWHDWHCLTNEARKLKAEAPELAYALELETERQFAAAMKSTEATRGRLLGEWMASAGKVPAKGSLGSSVGIAARKRA